LKLEEKKAWKKIEETKKKAEQVMKIRARNDDDKANRDRLRQQREQEEEERLRINEENRILTRNNIASQNNQK
jgi:hypothetical protein